MDSQLVFCDVAKMFCIFFMQAFFAVIFWNFFFACSPLQFSICLDCLHNGSGFRKEAIGEGSWRSEANDRTSLRTKKKGWKWTRGTQESYWQTQTGTNITEWSKMTTNDQNLCLYFRWEKNNSDLELSVNVKDKNSSAWKKKEKPKKKVCYIYDHWENAPHFRISVFFESSSN